MFKKLKSDVIKVPNKLKSHEMMKLTHKIINFYGKFYALKNLRSRSSKSTVELDFMCPWELSGPLAVTLTKKLKY